KYLGTEIYGLWATLSVVLILGQLGQLRIDTAIIKYVAGEYRKENFNAITEYISTAFYILILPSLIVVGVLALFNNQIARFIEPNEIFINISMRLIIWIGFLSVFSFYVNVIRGVIVGIGRLDIVNYVSLVSRILQIILAVCFLVLNYGIWSLYFAYLFYFVLLLIVWYLILKNVYQIKIFQPFSFRIQKANELIKFGGTLFSGTVVEMCVVPFNKVIIARYIGLSEVTYYQIAFHVVRSMRDLLVNGLEALLPRISEMYGETMRSLSAIFVLHKKAIKFILICASPIFLISFIFANPLLRTWLGPKFDIQIVFALRVLIIGWFINTLAVPDYFMFLGIGKEKYSVAATFLKSITNVTLILSLIFLNSQITFTKVVVIDSISLTMAVIFLKYKYFKFKTK
ncbi:oligosaccharide flippase family protein, partial [Acidobacteriota bacterium]